MSRLTKQNRNRNSTHSSESTHLSTPADPLSPPRPFFFASDTARSSTSESSLSDSDREQQQPTSPVATARLPQARRRSGMASSGSYAAVSPGTPISASFTRRRNSNGATGPSNPFTAEPSDTGYAYPQDSDTYAPVGAGAEDHELSPTWNATNLYYNSDPEEPASPRSRVTSSSRPPPSSFQYPFQAHPGNPDPLPVRRRSSSFESVTTDQTHWPAQPGAPGRTFSDASHDAAGLPLPAAPFMGLAAGDRHSASSSSLSGMGSGNGVYRNSAAAGMMSPSQTALNAAYQAGQASASASGGLPRISSQPNFRAPFLSPASRPNSSFWNPPSYANSAGSPHGGSVTALALPAPPAPAPSTRLAGKLSKEEKPWLQRAPPRARASWWLTFACMVLGLAGAVALCFFGVTGVNVFKDSDLCSVFEDNFSGSSLDTNIWTREAQLGGFGNAEFQIASPFENNSYIRNNQLYIMPTLTTDIIPESQIDSGSFTLDPCTEAETNKTACSASGDGNGNVVNPVMSARINTKASFSITYGRVEVRAKLPRGDWLWPAIWMLPVNGTWPVDGEIDIMEGRGNSPEYEAQGSNYVRSTLQYGPLTSLVKLMYGWYALKRTSFDKGFHTYGLEWNDKWMRFYVDTRVHTVLDISLKSAKEGFWARAGFPETAQNGSSVVPVVNPYTSLNGPFDQPFYLVIDLAVGGTSGWFPDKVGGKPWFDGSLTAMRDFWKAKDTWWATWPTNQDDRAFRIDSVKMWKKC